jgi:hypothetical protein
MGGTFAAVIGGATAHVNGDAQCGVVCTTFRTMLDTTDPLRSECVRGEKQAAARPRTATGMR